MSRDHRSDRPQLVIGLLCAAAGCPVAVEVFEGNTADPATLRTQIGKIRERFHLQRVVMVGDRGLLTSARIDATLRPAGLDWITALRAPAIKALAAAGGRLQLSLFDDRDMAEITSPDYPGDPRLRGGWWSARTRCSPRSGHANARNCWRQRRHNWSISSVASSGRSSHCRVRQPSVRRSGRCWAVARWPSISRSI